VLIEFLFLFPHIAEQSRCNKVITGVAEEWQNVLVDYAIEKISHESDKFNPRADVAPYMGLGYSTFLISAWQVPDVGYLKTTY
jgi:hypothetical protein